ncbi:MAG: hypothetical protein SFY56_12715 [Bacteroidota bacterium]|nr:hypothetical protein [Bacteroidota bacterium]
MNKKEKWLTDVENSLNGIESAEVSPYLYHKIITRINGNAKEYVSNRFVFASLVSFFLLLSFNLFIFKSLDKGNSTSKNDLIKVSKAFQLVNENEINYN